MSHNDKPRMYRFVALKVHKLIFDANALFLQPSDTTLNLTSFLFSTEGCKSVKSEYRDKTVLFFTQI